MIGSKFSRHFFNHSPVKPKPIVACACTFSHALRRQREITSRFDWFTGLSPSFLIDQSNYFGFGFYDTRLKLALTKYCSFLSFVQITLCLYVVIVSVGKIVNVSSRHCIVGKSLYLLYL